MKTISKLLVLVTILQSLLILASTDAMATGPFKWRRIGSGCVGKNSLITLSDGREVKISSIKSSLTLPNILGNDVRILHTTVGPEQQMIRVTLESGKTVLATHDHPFINSSGAFIKTNEITTASTLSTIDGDERVTKVETIDYNDTVYNLYLSSLDLLEDETLIAKQKRQDPFAGLNAKSHTYFVNGIASGDLLIQKVL